MKEFVNLNFGSWGCSTGSAFWDIALSEDVGTKSGRERIESESYYNSRPIFIDPGVGWSSPWITKYSDMRNVVEDNPKLWEEELRLKAENCNFLDSFLILNDLSDIEGHNRTKALKEYLNLEFPKVPTLMVANLPCKEPNEINFKFGGFGNFLKAAISISECIDSKFYVLGTDSFSTSRILHDFSLPSISERIVVAQFIADLTATNRTQINAETPHLGKVLETLSSVSEANFLTGHSTTFGPTMSKENNISGNTIKKYMWYNKI
eukprot:GHVP01048531.1.p1 GENE.GHVP01048531.1~~GHVP01048531.1.p1  ORF type:complete len:264 (+),score=44.36 GHVP01048531.1:233-1024(+)